MESQNTNKGYIYVLINPSMADMVKIGRTTKDPTKLELSPFILVYYKQFKDCDTAEKEILAHLKDKGFYFKVPVPDVINTVQNISDIKKDNTEVVVKIENVNDGDAVVVSHNDNKDSKIPDMRYFEKGHNFELGINGCSQDLDKAISQYLLAVKYGEEKAYFAIGEIYYHHKKDIRKAIDEYQKGGEKGDIRCFAALGIIYISETEYRNEKNANIAWEKFFANINLLSSEDVIKYIREYLYWTLGRKRKINKKWESIIKQYNSELIANVEKRKSTIYTVMLKYLLSLNNNNTSVMPSPKKESRQKENQQKRIARLLVAGKSKDEIMKELNVSYQVVSNVKSLLKNGKITL